MADAHTVVKQVSERRERVILDLSIAEAKAVKHALTRVNAVYAHRERAAVHEALVKVFPYRV